MTSLKLKDLNILPSQAALRVLPAGKLLINTINVHSYNTAQKEPRRMWRRYLIGNTLFLWNIQKEKLSPKCKNACISQLK